MQGGLRAGEALWIVVKVSKGVAQAHPAHGVAKRGNTTLEPFNYIMTEHDLVTGAVTTWTQSSTTTSTGGQWWTALRLICGKHASAKAIIVSTNKSELHGWVDQWLSLDDRKLAAIEKVMTSLKAGDEVTITNSMRRVCSSEGMWDVKTDFVDTISVTGRRLVEQDQLATSLKGGAKVLHTVSNQNKRRSTYTDALATGRRMLNIGAAPAGVAQQQ
jgi:hypothetical protein